MVAPVLKVHGEVEWNSVTQLTNNCGGYAANCPRTRRSVGLGNVHGRQREEALKKLGKDWGQWRKRIRRICGLRCKRELRLTPGFQSHEALWKVTKKLPTDFEPYGKRERSNRTIQPDCSCGCRWYHILAGTQGQDWGVCGNPKSPRRGLLTFEHQGCPKFELDKRWDYLKSAAGKRALKRFKQGEREIQEFNDAQQWISKRLPGA